MEALSVGLDAPQSASLVNSSTISHIFLIASDCSSIWLSTQFFQPKVLNAFFPSPQLPYEDNIIFFLLWRHFKRKEKGKHDAIYKCSISRQKITTTKNENTTIFLSLPLSSISPESMTAMVGIRILYPSMLGVLITLKSIPNHSIINKVVYVQMSVIASKMLLFFSQMVFTAGIWESR